MLAIEKETIINYNETNEPASVYTFNRALQNKLDSLVLECPESVKIISNYAGGAKEYLLPKKLVTIKKPVKLSSEQREKMSKIARERFGHKKEEAEP